MGKHPNTRIVPEKILFSPDLILKNCEEKHPQSLNNELINGSIRFILMPRGFIPNINTIRHGNFSGFGLSERN
jgi:hypothetical protein